MVTFWEKLEQEQGTGYQRKFELMLIDFPVMSWRCCHLV